MFDSNMRLVSMLGVLTVIVITALVIDYLRIAGRPMRLGLVVAVTGIAAGVALTLSAVLPDNHIFGKVCSQVTTTSKVVALTFDDGPYPPYTGQILDILRESGVRATFFVIGQNAEKHPEELQRMVQDGHQVGNHSYNHIDLLKADRKKIAEEIDRTSRVIEKATGQVPRVVRPPHGFRDPAVLEIMAERRLKVVEWSVMSRDWLEPGVDVIVNRTLQTVKNGSVILLHDGDGTVAKASRAQTVDAVRIIIKQLLAQGYTFVTVDEILARSEDTKQ